MYVSLCIFTACPCSYIYSCVCVHVLRWLFILILVVLFRPVHMSTYIAYAHGLFAFACVLIWVFILVSLYVGICSSMYLYTYLSTHLITYMHTCMHTNIPTYIQTYIRTDMHTYICAFILSFASFHVISFHSISFMHSFIYSFIYVCACMQECTYIYIYTYTILLYTYAYLKINCCSYFTVGVVVLGLGLV